VLDVFAVAMVFWVVVRVLLGCYKCLMCNCGCCAILGGFCCVSRVFRVLVVLLCGCNGVLGGCWGVVRGF